MIITVTSDRQNPFKFNVDFANHHINVEDEYEIALLKIHYTSIFNVTEANNKLHIEIRSTPEQVIQVVILITPGYYRDAHVLLSKIYDALEDYLMFYDAEYETELTKTLLWRKEKIIGYTIVLPTYWSFLVESDKFDSNILSSMLLKTVDGTPFRNLSIESNWEFSSPDNVAFIYTNLVENSIFNNRKSRLLATIPISPEHGYICYEPTNLIYHKFSVNSFISARFEIRDNNGQIFNSAFENDTSKSLYCPTIITLSVRKSTPY